MNINLSQLLERKHVPKCLNKEIRQAEACKARDFLLQHGYSERNPKVFKTLVSLMVGLKCGTISKGVFWMGDRGVGKSFGAEFLSAYCKTDFVAANDLTDVYATDADGRAAFESLAYPCFLGRKDQPKDLIIDELGKEPNPVNYFGTKVRVLEKVLQERYRLWERYGARTIITTNCELEELKNLYGEYIYDRVQQMCNVVAAVGDDLRIAA